MSSTKGTSITRTPFVRLPTRNMVDGVAFRYPIARLPHTHDGIMVFVHPHLTANPERITAWTGQSKRQVVETALNELARSLQYNEQDTIHGGGDEQALVEPNHPYVAGAASGSTVTVVNVHVHIDGAELRGLIKRIG